jgi:ABC-type dipeptide/oligopeptide/nickel transport system permease component
MRNILLPCLALATIPLAVITRMTRSAMLEERDKDYVRTARAKGATTKRVVLRHVLRNALIPITTITGMQFGALMGGAVLTESVFNWPGLGRFIVDRGVGERDTPVLVGASASATRRCWSAASCSSPPCSFSPTSWSTCSTA